MSRPARRSRWSSGLLAGALVVGLMAGGPGTGGQARTGEVRIGASDPVLMGQQDSEESIPLSPADVDLPASNPIAEPGTTQGPAAEDLPKVADEVRQALADADAGESGGSGEDAGTVDVVIELAEQADTGALARAGRNAAARTSASRSGSPAEVAEAARAARVTAVGNGLREVADRTQGPVRHLLDEAKAAGNASDIRQFWIFNGFTATIDATALRDLERHPVVGRISVAETMQLPEPELDTETEPRLPEWGLEKVRATDVWADLGYTGEGVVVGIVDSGVDATHPALADRFRGKDGDVEHSWFVATGEDYPEPYDGGGHGTHVTGTVMGGAPGRTIGVAPGAQWIAAKAFRDGASSTPSAYLLASLEWMLQPGGDPTKAPHVVSNSWGSSDTNSTYYNAVIDALVAAGIVPVFSAGNNYDYESIGSPGSYPPAIAVGATDPADGIALFSSRGPVYWDGVEYLKPDVTAPGDGVLSSVPLWLDDYATASGTSMAAPHVSGVVALMLSANPDLSVDEVRALLESTARGEEHMGRLPNTTFGHGIVDAYAAIQAAADSGTVAGSVTGPDGPIQAKVAVTELGMVRHADEAGHFEFRLGAGTWTIEATAYGYQTTSTTVTITHGGAETADLTLTPQPEHTVSGTVTSGGEPVPDAAVRTADTPVAPVFTDAGGRYSFTVAAGEYTVYARATGFDPAEAEAVVDGDITVDLELSANSPDSEPGWTQYGNNPRRTAAGTGRIAADGLTELWDDYSPGSAVYSSPVVGEGTVLMQYSTQFGTGTLQARDLETGDRLWDYRDTGQYQFNQRTTPAIADGVVYHSGAGGMFYARDAETGDELWSVALGDRLYYTAPTVVGGIVYFSTGMGVGDGGWVYALDAGTGDLVWRTFIGSYAPYGVAYGDGKVFAASYDEKRMVALDAATGVEQWSAPTELGVFGVPAYADGVVYAVAGLETGPGILFALDASDGSRLWEVADNGSALSAPTVAGDLVVVGTDSRQSVAAYDRHTGEREWFRAMGGEIANGLIWVDDVVIGGSRDDRMIFALDASTGETVWSDELTSGPLSAPAFADGVLIAQSTTGPMVAYTSPGELSVTVTDAGGEPLQATVTVVETDTDASTDPATGTATITHTEGDYTVEVVAYGYRTGTRQVRIHPGRTTEVELALASADAGTVRGVVTGPDGVPLRGPATVTLVGTDLPPVQTDGDGRFEFAEVAAGRFELNVDAVGYIIHNEEFELAAGDVAEFTIELGRYEIAVTGDHDGKLTAFLTGRGYAADSTTIERIADDPGAYRLVVAAGANDDPGAEVFGRFLENADAARTSVIFLNTWGNNYGALRHLSLYAGDPEVVGTSSTGGVVDMVSRLEHPLTAGLTVGERTNMLPSAADRAWFDGYSGHVVADLYDGTKGVVGNLVGYQARTVGSVHVLLGSHGVSPWSGPSSWSPAGVDMFVNALDYAENARFGRVAGTVTDTDGQPLEATLTVELPDGTVEETTSAADGGYELLLPPGEHTMSVRLVGYASVEHQVTATAEETLDLDVTLEWSGHGAIVGAVTGNGRALGGATVEVVGTDLMATTDDHGSYVLADVPAGTHSLRFTATDYRPKTVGGIEVTGGRITQFSTGLDRAPRVAMVGDYNGQIADVLRQRDAVVTEVGWDLTERLDEFDVVVFGDPSDPGETQFTEVLRALDDAEVSAIFLEGGSSSGAIRLLRKYTSEPGPRQQISGDGRPLYRLTQPDHPLFDGLTDPVQVLHDGRWADYFTDYDGIELASFGTDELGTLGVGAGYRPRTANSVRLLLSGLEAYSLARPDPYWTADGKRLFGNAVEWAANPEMAMLAGRVIDPDGEPVPEATVTVADTGLSATADEAGAFTLAHPAGSYRVEVNGFGFAGQQHLVDLTAGETLTLDAALAVGDVGRIAGEVVDTSTGEPVAGARVALEGAPRDRDTDQTGGFALERIEPGEYTVSVEADGYVRQGRITVEVAVGETTSLDLDLRPAPSVGVLDDYGGRLTAYLLDWGYRAEEIDWQDTGRVGDFDVLVANQATTSSSFNLDADGWRAMSDAIDRAGVSVVWLDQYSRGGIRLLHEFEGDPATLGGTSTADPDLISLRIDSEHPLVAGFDVGDEVPVLDGEDAHSWFDDFGGRTVASVMADGEVKGAGIGYRGRTPENVDVLLASMSVSTYGYPPHGDVPRDNYTEQAERLLHNAIGFALDAPGSGARATGVVTDAGSGEPLAAAVTVRETGKVYPVRASDGTFLVPLDPGTWTLDVELFGYATVSRTITVGPGEGADLGSIAMASAPAGDLVGTVTDPDGAPVPDVDLTVEGTPLGAVSAADGTYRIAGVPAGLQRVRAHHGAGLADRYVDVSVIDGQEVRLDIGLEPSTVVAVSGDHSSDALTEMLEANGYTVSEWSWGSGLVDHIADLDTVDLVALNGNGTLPSSEHVNLFLDAAEEAERSVILSGQYSGGSIRAASVARQDPKEWMNGFVRDGAAITYTPTISHPIFDGFETGEPIVLMRDARGGSQQFVGFEGYSGRTIASLDEENGGRISEGAAYRFTSPSSVEVVLSSLGAAGTTYGQPGHNWTAAAERIYLNAVDYAANATEAQVVGRVTSGGEPVTDAEPTVLAVEAGVAVGVDADGGYQVGLPRGTHTLEVGAFGYETHTEQVEVGDSGTVRVDIDLTRSARGAVAGAVTGPDGEPVAGADLLVTGLGDVAETEVALRSADDGTYAVEDLVPGDYRVEVDARYYGALTDEFAVVADRTTTLDPSLDRIRVGVVGDVNGLLTKVLGADSGIDELGVEQAGWSWDPGRYDTVVVNGGDPTEAEFTAFVEAADAAETSLVFTGTWGVNNGGIHVLDRYTDEVVLAERGYGDGPVGLEPLDTEHPLFDGVSDPAKLLAVGSYWQGIDSYTGHRLADLTVGGQDSSVTGIGAAYDYRSAGSVHLLLGTAGVSSLVGPGYGWSDDAETLLGNAVGWATEVTAPEPAQPTLTVAADEVVADPTVGVTGTAEYRTTVEIRRGAEVVTETTVEPDGTFAATVELVEGPNRLIAVAVGHGGRSPGSEVATVTLDTTAPGLEWGFGERVGTFDPVFEVTGRVSDAHAGVAEVEVAGTVADVDSDGRFVVEVGLEPGVNDITATVADAVGNAADYTAQVRRFDHDADALVIVTRRTVASLVTVTDSAGRGVRLDDPTLSARDGDGATIASGPLCPLIGGLYVGTLTRVRPAPTTVHAEFELDGWSVDLELWRR